jgi:hypothetical protein
MKVDAMLLTEWRARPGDTFRLILRVSTDLDQATAKLADKNIKVRRRCKLINGLVIESSGAQAASLLAESWVLSAELDQPVQAWIAG